MRKTFLTITAIALLVWAGPAAFGQCSQSSTCRNNGHTVSLGGTSPLQSLNWLFSEDITGQNTTPIADNVVVTNAGFVKIATGCVDTGEINVASLGTFHGIFRVQTSIANATASSGSRFQVQLRLGVSPTDPNPRILLDDTRRIHGQYPQSDHFGVIVPNVTGGQYVYSVWAKLLTSGSITFTNTWSTSQGMPASVTAKAITAPSDVSVSTNWTNVGPSLSFSNASNVDLILGSRWQIVSGTTAPGLQIRYAVDGVGPSTQFGQIGVPAAAGLPEGYAAFDGLPNIGIGSHTVQLQMRTTNYTAIIRGATLEFAAPQSTQASPPSWPMMTSIATNTVRVTEAGSPEQPSALPGGSFPIDGCGRWTLLQEFEVPAHSGDYDWIFQVYTQLLGNLTGTPRAQLAIENIFYLLDANGNRYAYASSDNGITGFMAPTGRDGLYTFGEVFRWGNGAGGNRIRLWARRITGCGSGLSGGFDIGKRYITMKLMPAEGCYPN